MFELWTKWPANLVTSFDTAAEGELLVKQAIALHGLMALENHALLFSDDEENFVGIAENEVIIQQLTMLRIVDELSAAASVTPTRLSRESNALFASFESSLEQIQIKPSLPSDDWLKGFLAAASHDVSIDITAGKVIIGKPKTTSNPADSGLKSTG